MLAVKKSKLIYLEMTESTNSMRSVNSVGKVDFAWSGIVENLNGEILFASFVKFFEQSIVQSFRLVNTFSCKNKTNIIQINVFHWIQFKGTIQPGLRLLPSGNFFLALNRSHHFFLKKSQNYYTFSVFSAM